MRRTGSWHPAGPPRALPGATLARGSQGLQRRSARSVRDAWGSTLATLPPPMRALLLLLWSLLAACDGPSEGAPPNVVLVTLDTTRPDYLSCYSPTRGGTPTLQRIADEGVRFDAALSSSGVTPVSHATILTGRFPYEHGVRVLSAGSGFKLPEDQPTLASILRERGYRTAAIQSSFPVSAYFGFDRHFDVFEQMAGEMMVDERAGKTIWDGASLQRRSDESTELVLDFLERSGEEEDPFFLWLHLWDPHDPWLKPPPSYLSHLDLPEGHMSAASELYAQVYAAEVRYMDSQLGRVLADLEERGLADRTLVCVTADHGEGLSDGYQRHRWSKHRMTYQEQLHVPLLLQGPGVPVGLEVADMVRTADIAPTLLELAGFPDAFPGGAGRSLVPLLQGRRVEPAVAYADQINGYDANASMVDVRPDSAFLHTVCDGEWKLTYRPHMFEASELYNLKRDPDERRNVIADHPDVYLRLMADLAARDPWVLAEFPITDEFDERAQRGLEEIGYGGGGGGNTGQWWWCCPEHPDYRRDTRDGPGGTKRHGEGGCEHPVVPRTTFQAEDG